MAKICAPSAHRSNEERHGEDRCPFSVLLGLETESTIPVYRVWSISSKILESGRIRYCISAFHYLEVDHPTR